MIHTVLHPKSIKKPVNIKNITLKITAACLISTCMIGLSNVPVSASGVSLSTFPTTLQLRAVAPADLRSGFSIQNQGSQTVKLNIQLRPFKADPGKDGKVQLLEGNDPRLQQKVQIVDNGFAVSSIELGPKQTKNLSLRMKLDEREPVSDYYFSVVFLTADDQPAQESTEDVTAASGVQTGIALNVLVAAGPKELPNGMIEEFSTNLYRDSGPVPFTVKVKNTGPHFITPKGVILIKNIFGQTVGRVDLLNTNILAGTSRSLLGTPYTLSANNTRVTLTETSVQASDNPSKAIWPEKFLLGIYSAELSLALSEDGPLYNQTIRFLAFPSKFLIIVGLIGIIILLISWRVRKITKRT